MDFDLIYFGITLLFILGGLVIFVVTSGRHHAKRPFEGIATSNLGAGRRVCCLEDGRTGTIVGPNGAPPSGGDEAALCPLIRWDPEPPLGLQRVSPIDRNRLRPVDGGDS